MAAATLVRARGRAAAERAARPRKARREVVSIRGFSVLGEHVLDARGAGGTEGGFPRMIGRRRGDRHSPPAKDAAVSPSPQPPGRDQARAAAASSKALASSSSGG